jgi:nucleotide-binding universal stress UspA family protein
LLAGVHRLSTTVLPVEESAEKQALAPSIESDRGDAGAAVKAAGKNVELVDQDAEVAGPLDVVTRPSQAVAHEAVLEEAKNRYDLLAIGLEPIWEHEGVSNRIARIVESFDGPVAIISARGPHRDDPKRAERDILVPVTGTDFSRQGAEVALSLARAMDATVTALHVTNRRRNRSWRGNFRTALTGNSGIAVLREIVHLGEQQGVKVRPLLKRHGEPEDVILRQVEMGQHDIVIMGVSQRPGATLSFGDVPDVILHQANRSILLVAGR